MGSPIETPRSDAAFAEIPEIHRYAFIRDGERQTVEATLRRGPQGGAQTRDQGLERLSGADLRDLEPGDPRYGEISGVVVVGLDPASRAARSGLEAGDIILAVNRRPVASVEELREELAKIDRALALTVQRGSARIFLIMR